MLAWDDARAAFLVDEVEVLLAGIARQSNDEASFLKRLGQGGVEAASAWFDARIQDTPGRIPFREDTINELGYEAMILHDDGIRCVAELQAELADR